MSARVSVVPRAAQLRARSARGTARRAVTPRASLADLPKENKDTKVLVVGGTGYIGKFVVRELCAQGYDVTALVREKSGIGGKTGADEAKALFPDALAWSAFNVCVDAVFLLELLVCARTGYWQAGMHVTASSAVLLHYLQTDLLIDAVAYFPYCWAALPQLAELDGKLLSG